jgi:bacteriophage HK97-gp10 putative tail-component
VARANVRVIHNQRALNVLLSSPTGAVAKDLFRRGKKVETKAKLNLQRPPKRVDTGHLRSSIHTQLVIVNGAPAVRVGTLVEYAIYVHDGTGIYGPRHTYIRPVTAKVLSWKTKGGHRIYAYKVRGMKPNPFLRDAMSAAKD